MKKAMSEKDIAIYVIPMNDFHGSEYISDYFKLIRYFSGFTGSAGTLVVTQEETCLWTDGRYFLQAAEELDGTGILLQKAGEPGVPAVFEYIRSYVENERVRFFNKVGFDGRLVSASFVNKLKDCMIVTGLDLAGEVWDADREDKRPLFRQQPLWILDEKFAGESVQSKLSHIRKDMKKEGADSLLLTTPDDIAWLTNLRGGDISYNPVFLSYMILTETEAVLYTKTEDKTIGDYLSEYGITKRPYDDFYTDVSNIDENHVVWVDEMTASYRVVTSIPESCKKLVKINPVIRRKAVKNVTEVENIKSAHKKDAVAVTKFIYWLKARVCTGEETVTEITAAEKLEELRKEQKNYLGPSFAPIVAYGPHGAIVHYSASESTDVLIKKDSFLLVDTGGHYLEGTTDITRTIAMGNLTKEQKIHYTAVLLGNLRLMNARFKKGLMGANLDYLAREPLYRLGLDFNHGTGHGVGYLCSVHEAPNAFRMRQDDESVFEEGMVTSDEPGFYLEDAYGIRLENLIVCVKEKETSYGQFLKFEPLTLVPFDSEAICTDMLTEEDKRLLETYHRSVYEAISGELNEEERIWLKQVTGEITR